MPWFPYPMIFFVHWGSWDWHQFTLWYLVPTLTKSVTRKQASTSQHSTVDIVSHFLDSKDGIDQALDFESEDALMSSLDDTVGELSVPSPTELKTLCKAGHSDG